LRQAGEARDLAVTLPDNRLEGEVVTQVGAPVPDATVSLVSFAPSPILVRGIKAGADGRFLARGLRAGTYTAEAQTGGARSEGISIDVPEEGSGPSLRLVVRRVGEVTGQVVSPHGPVAGAQVMAFARASDGSPPIGLPDAVTDVEGKFRLELTDPVAGGTILVQAPGWVLSLQPYSGAGEVTIHLDQRGGSLVLTGLDPLPAGEHPFIVFSGQPIDTILLRSWGQVQGSSAEVDPTVVPGMPEGHYHLCRARFDELLLVYARRAVPTRCSEGHLTAGGKLELTLP
jgi:hypothetical protein